MIDALRRAVLALALLALPLAARADQLLRVAPHRAAIGVRADSGPLYGDLARPAGPGPFPAVVVLHGCAGFGPPDIAAAARLRAVGYLALALDSLGGANACRHPGGARAEAEDAVAALRFLVARRDVAPGRIALLGFSMGGFAVLDAITRGGIAPATGPRFAAAVAYYPNCRRFSGVMSVPLLILIGARDDWTPAAACRALLTRRAGRGAPVSLVVYPGATYAFNVLGRPHVYLGHAIRYDPAAARAAWARVRVFLHAHLAPPASVPPASAPAPGAPTLAPQPGDRR